MKQRSPQEKKELSYARDGRNAYGENDKASRKAIPRRKRERLRAIRRRMRQQLPKDVLDVSADQVEDMKRSIDGSPPKRAQTWRKTPDVSLREWLARKAR